MGQGFLPSAGRATSCDVDRHLRRCRPLVAVRDVTVDAGAAVGSSPCFPSLPHTPGRGATWEVHVQFPEDALNCLLSRPSTLHSTATYEGPASGPTGTTSVAAGWLGDLAQPAPGREVVSHRGLRCISPTIVSEVETSRCAKVVCRSSLDQRLFDSFARCKATCFPRRVSFCG